MATDNLPPLKRIVKFPTFESILNFPNVGKSRKSPYPPNQQFICPNCSELTNGFPCEHCGYDEESDYDPYEGQ